MGLLPCPHAPALFLHAREQVAAKASALPYAAPQDWEPFCKFREGESQPWPCHLSLWSCQDQSPECHLRFCLCLASPTP